MSALNSFRFPISALLAAPSKPLRFEVAGRFDDLFVTSSAIQPDRDVVVRGVIEAAHPGLLVSATIDGAWVGECVRCLERAEGHLSVSVREIFEPESEVLRDDEAEEEIYTFDAEIIDLSQMVRDAVVLDLPIVPLCKADCLGLCVECGANLNHVASGTVTHDCDQQSPILREIIFDR